MCPPLFVASFTKTIKKTSVYKVFEIGCGSGVTANMLHQSGYEVVGIDASKTGIEQANKAFPQLQLYHGSAYSNLSEVYGQFPIVVSLEVVEHVFDPRQFAKTFYKLLEEDGLGIISTPYHGYFKNVALAITGKMDAHFTALWDGGHIKFWSMETLKQLLLEAGFRDIYFIRVGRVPILAKSMIAIFRK
jgi:2-polyprenyl-3-methyl-5-hydroxy-6-metoxy-1,4-benzoquinol methylase